MTPTNSSAPDDVISSALARYTISQEHAPAPHRLPESAQAVLEAEYANMMACVRCGLCLTSCPTYVLTGNETEGPRGRIALVRALTEGRIPLTDELVIHQENCLACDACTDVCPAGVRMEPLQVAVRTVIEDARGHGAVPIRSAIARLVRTIVFDWVFMSMTVFRAVVLLAWVYRKSGLRAIARATGIVRLIGLQAADELLPDFTPKFLIANGQRLPPTVPLSDGVVPDAVSLFAGCVMSTALGAIDHATVRVLQRAGCEVSCTAGQGCCGALHAHSGDREGMLRLAQSTIAAFERDGDTPVVVNSAGCGAMLKEYGHLFADDPVWSSRATRFSRRVRDFSDFVSPRALPTLHALRETESVITYQDACHLSHAQRIVAQPRALLQRIPGVTLREMDERSLCCGSAGVYNVTHPETARELGDWKALSVGRTDATVMVTANPGCLLQMQAALARQGSTVRVRHLADLLDEATDPAWA